MRRPRWWPLLWCWPWDLVCWAMVLMVRAIWGRGLRWERGAWCELRPGSWLDRVYGQDWAGVTLGHGGILGPGWAGGPGVDTPVERHEHVHVEQYEAASLIGLAGAAAVCGTALLRGVYDPALLTIAAALWPVAGAGSYLAAMLTALARGEAAYRGNHLEEAAYNNGEVHRD